MEIIAFSNPSVGQSLTRTGTNEHFHPSGSLAKAAAQSGLAKVRVQIVWRENAMVRGLPSSLVHLKNEVGAGEEVPPRIFA